MSWYNPLSWGKDIVQTNVFNTDGTYNRDYFIPLGAAEYFFNINEEQSCLRAFNECPPLKNIILKRSKAFNAGIIEVVKTTESQNYVKDQDILNLLNRPNVLQTQKQFFAQQNIYIDIFGYCPVLKIKGAFNVITSIWNIPPWLFDLNYTGKWLKQNKVQGIYSDYVLMWEGGRTDLNFDDLFFIFDDSIGTQTDAALTIPDSRMVSQEYPINNIIGTYKSLNTLISKKGAIGILSNSSKDQIGTVPLNPEDKKQLQDDFKSYGLTGQANQIIITNASLNWQSMALPIKDMLFFEGLQEFTNSLCDAYGYPPELLAQAKKDINYENKKAAKKDLFSSTIIPEGNSRMEQFSNGIIEPDKKQRIQYNFEMIDVLQEEKLIQYQAEAAINTACQTEYNAGLITKNDWRIRLGLDKLSEAGFDDYKNTEITQDGFTQQN